MSWKLLKNSESLLLREIRKISPENVYIGVSGGLDSVVLAHFVHMVLKKHSLGITPTVLHLNHSLRDNSDGDELFVKKLSNVLRFNFLSHKVPKKIAESWESNTEHRARLERIKFFREKCKTRDLLLLGHHLDDDIEWNLLQRFKSSNMGSSMYIPMKNEFTFRPFLEVPRSDLSEVSSILGLTHITDESNLNNKFERNFLRNEIVPLIDSRFSNFREHFLFQKYQSLSLLSETFISKLIFNNQNFSTVYLADVPKNKDDLFKVINFWVNSSLRHYSVHSGRGKISRQIIKIIEGYLNFKKGPLLLSGGWCVYIDTDCLHFMQKSRVLIQEFKPFKLKGNNQEKILSIIRNGPIYLMDKDPGKCPASAFGIDSMHDGYYPVTTGYIIKNLKYLTKINFSLFKANIKEITS
jgi:tRNA(Ile)-lysidine synthetase-like protein